VVPPPRPAPGPSAPTEATLADDLFRDRSVELPEEASGPLPLPHWTEPPTGEVPQIAREVDDGDGDDDDLDAWASTSGSQPRFRGDVGDWAASDFGEDLKDDATALGALADEVPEQDEHEVFAAEVAARRTRSRRGRGRGGPPPVPPTPPAPPRRSPPPRRYPSVAQPRSTRPLPVRDDLTTRVVTGLVIAAVALLAFAIGRAGTAVLASAVLAACAFELYDGFRRAGIQPATVLGLLACTSMVGIAYNDGERAFPLVGALLVGFTLFWYLARVVHARPMVNAAVTLLGYGYVGVLGGFAGLLLAYPDGVGLVAGLAICAVGYDIFGFLVGSRMGHRPLAPHISPNKTVEGLVGGMIASIVLGAIVSKIFGLHPWNALSDGLLLGIVVAIFAPLGDLCESMLKRDLGVKDFGNILPGHGGVLDRFDAILFCLPAVYYLVVARGIV